MEKTENLYLVDTFTRFDHPSFSGNPAMVCFIDFDDHFTDEKKQKLANEFNQPATAFVSKGWNKSNPILATNSWKIRWFSPTTELPLCGHGTFAASTVLFENARSEGFTTLLLESKLGHKLESVLDSSNGMITVILPANPPKPISIHEEPLINALINITVRSKELIHDVQFPDKTGLLIFVLNKPDDSSSEEFIRSFKPDYKKMLSTVPENSKIRGIGITVRGDLKVSKSTRSTIQYYSRVFLPFQGIDEDSVCGSLHTVLVPYWDRVFKTENLKHLNGFVLVRQASERTGDIFVKHEDDQVFMKGNGIIVTKGKFNMK